MHILGPLLLGRSRALCRLLGSFWPRNRFSVNPNFERPPRLWEAARVGRFRGTIPTCNSSTFRRFADQRAELLFGPGQLAPDFMRSLLRMTSFSPDQTSHTAHTLTSTKPSGRASSRIVSSVMSVSTLAAFFGPDTQT